MLELPDVEVLRKDLEKEIVGKRIKDVAVQSTGLVKPFHRNRPELIKALEGRKIDAVRRRGHTLFVDLDDEHTWVIDPGASGQLFRETATAEAGSDTHLTVSFTTGGAIHLSEEGSEPTASTGVVATEGAYEAAGVNPDALDPLDDNPTWMEFGRFLAAASSPLKLLLTDPQHVVGIGPMYSDEILWEAGLRHDRGSQTLSTQEVRRLYRAMHEVIFAAMKQVGASLEENEPVEDDEEIAEHLRVHGRDGLPCPRCRRPIVRTRIKKGIYTYRCERCMI
ncbi:MAG: DNA-formamidopyrimidine glycosylase family protein [Nitriliruptor sp.]|uniref:DNA-formamidopyrimidine glycosylase family protein n=1 Tax=Nitriliruptor sp. TaxID=2448056 RepID=UPI00349FFE57